MVVETSKENLNINKIVCEREKLIYVEGDIIVPDAKPDILNTINTSGNICIYKKELFENKIKLDGGINVYIMYMPDSSNDIVRGINTNLDFSEVFDAPNCRENMILDINAELKNIECNLINGRKVHLKANIDIKYKLYANENVDLINDILKNEDIKILKNNKKVNSLVGFGNTKVYAKETVMIDNVDNLAEILQVNINIIDKDIKTSYNKVLAKSEAEIKILYLTEDNRVKSCLYNIPIVGFIDIQDVSEENICDINFEIKNIIIKPNNVEEHSIYIEMEIEVFCMAYEEKNINLLQDLYSPIQNLKYNKKEIIAISNKEKRSEIFHINEILNVIDLGDSSIIEVVIKPKITNANRLQSKINYEGEVDLDFIISNNDNQINISKNTLQFEFVLDNIKNDTNIINTEIEIGKNDFVIKTNNEVMVDIDLVFNINNYKNEIINIIDNIEVEENENLDDYSLVIYIVKPEDTLWSIAKKMRSTIEDIVKSNGLEDENNINVGEKLYIPRYVKYV